MIKVSVIKNFFNSLAQNVYASHSVVPDSFHPIDCSPPGSSVYGILQARILEWIAFPFSRGSFQPRDPSQVSCFVGRFFTIWATREVVFSIVIIQSLYLSWNWKFVPFDCLCLISPSTYSPPLASTKLSFFSYEILFVFEV